jgi:hypothetical protein
MADHDQLFKELLRTFFLDFLALVAPKLQAEVSAVAVHFLEQEMFTDWPHGSTREVDLLARAGEGEGCTFLIHTEIESSFGTEAARRLQRYFYLLKSRYDEPVFPILVTLRGGPAGVHRQILAETLAEHSQVFAYTSFGLSGCSAAEYFERPEPLAWGLAALMRPGAGGRAQQKLACILRIARAGLNDLQVFALVNCVESYLQLDPEEMAVFDRLRSLEENEEVQAMELTWADRMRAEGIQIGMEKGLEKGREEGARQLLARLLQQRFGELSPAALLRLAGIHSLDRLTRLAEEVLTARSLEELELA